MRVAVTGGTGRIGRQLRADLAAHGYEPVAVDLGPVRDQAAGYRRADLTAYWQVLDALDGVDAVVHLAAVGVPESHTVHPTLAEQATFASNAQTAYNVFAAAAEVGAARVVWATSETVLGAPFPPSPEATRAVLSGLPLDDDDPVQPSTSYGLSKAIGEELARHAARRTGITVVGLRFSVVMDDSDYAGLARYWRDPTLGRRNLWSYVDLRDVVVTCRLALTAESTGAVAVLVAAPDTVMDRPTAELVAEYLPGIPFRRPVPGHGSLLSSDTAAKLLGYRPYHSWRDSP